MRVVRLELTSGALPTDGFWDRSVYQFLHTRKKREVLRHRSILIHHCFQWLLLNHVKQGVEGSLSARNICLSKVFLAPFISLSWVHPQGVHTTDSLWLSGIWEYNHSKMKVNRKCWKSLIDGVKCWTSHYLTLLIQTCDQSYGILVPRRTRLLEARILDAHLPRNVSLPYQRNAMFRTRTWFSQQRSLVIMVNKNGSDMAKWLCTFIRDGERENPRAKARGMKASQNFVDIKPLSP